MTSAIRRQCADCLHEPDTSTGASRAVNLGITFLIVVNAIAVAVETMPGLPPLTIQILRALEIVSLAVFGCEFFLRVWSAVELPAYHGPIAGRLKYMARFLPAIDFLVLLTFFTALDLRFLRLMRIVRLLHVLRLERYAKAVKEIGRAIQRRKELLVVSLISMLLLVFFAAAGIYYLERDAQPAVFSSIPAAMWWAITTLTTVGYGDVVPITALGKLFAAVIATCGIAVFALPMAVVTTAVLEVSASAPDPD